MYSYSIHFYYTVNAPRVVKMSADVNELTITSGDDIDFSFNSTWLTNANFHWQKNGVNITTGNKYRGTTTDTLTLLNATEGDEGTYTLVVNIDGHNSWLNVTVSTGNAKCFSIQGYI